MRPASSFYAKIAGLFLALLLLLSLAYVLLSYRAAIDLIDEVEVRLNSGYAAGIAGALEPLVAGGIDEARIGQSIHYMMVTNPRVEIYLLDATGRVIAHFAATSAPLKEKRVDLAPITAFLAGRRDPLPLGSDPLSPGSRRPFSAAPFALPGGERGYVYVVLGGEQLRMAIAVLRESYFMRVTGSALLLTLLVTALSGLALFALLTRRLRRLTEAVEAFERGDLSRRVPTRTADEIDRLGLSFNRMADTIAADIDRLKEVDRLRRELVANVSHDLRSPLAAIRGYIETILLRDESLSREELRGYLDVTLRNARSLERLVEELFELSKLETATYRPSFEEVQLAELVQDVVLKVEAHAAAQQVKIVTGLPTDLPTVWADIALIERVLTNLLENAIRHTPPEGVIEIGLACEAQRVRVTVADTGSGISREDLPFIFERFYRGERSRLRAQEPSGTGAGLGLAIVKRIVELHGGEITATSEANAGSRFAFDLPCAGPPA